MKHHFPYRLLNLTYRYGKFAVVGAVAIAGLALKPAPQLNARSPQVLEGGEQQKSQATNAARVRQRDEQTRQVRPENYDLGRFPVTNQHEKHWRNILWTTAVVEPQENFVIAALDQVLAMMVLPGLSEPQMRTIDAATKVATQLYLRYPNLYGQLEQRFRQAVEQSPDPEWTAVSLSVLAKGPMPLEQVEGLAERVKARFPKWNQNVYLYTTVREIAEKIAANPSPPLADLLNWTIAPKQLQLYVICSPNRDLLCQTVLKDREGEFVRLGDGQLWSVPLLLRSIHSMRWNFVRGQTPNGIYRIEGVVPQPDDEFFRAYGQFPLVNLYVPFEAGARQFLPGKTGKFTGTLKDYQALLPPSWRHYWAIQQSYWAGKAGRSEFRIHGTGEAPEFFSNKGNALETYNWNPTIGCLSALELYNEQGQLLQADMPKILKALEIVGGKRFAGYLIVVEVPGQNGKPLTVQDIDTMLLQGKRPLRSSNRSKYVRKPAKAKPTTSQTVKQPAAKAAELSVIDPGAQAPVAPATDLDSLSAPVEPAGNETVRSLPMAY